MGVPVAFSEAQTEEQLESARRYVSARAGVFSQPAAGSFKIDPQNRQLLAMVSANALRQYRSGPDWNPQNPEWQRLAAIIENDAAELARELANDPRLIELSKAVEATFVRGIASRLAANELTQLADYYTGPSGAQFAQVQEKLNAALLSGMASMMARLGSGQRFEKPPIAPGPEALKELLGLFQETVSIQWAVADPGPGGDRTGLQAIPMMVGIAVRQNFAAMDAIWREIPEADRKAILVWRDAPLARKERQAIFESAKEIRKVLNPDEELRRFVDLLGRYDAKWRALIQAKP